MRRIVSEMPGYVSAGKAHQCVPDRAITCQKNERMVEENSEYSRWPSRCDPFRAIGHWAADQFRLAYASSGNDDANNISVDMPGVTKSPDFPKKPSKAGT